MKNNKKYKAASILCILYALLMFQEVMLTQVLCCKPNGSMDMELAFFGSKCDCDHSKLCLKSTPPSDFSGNSAIEGCNIGCFDLLVNSAWLERVAVDSSYSPYKLINDYDIAVNHSIQLDEPLTLLPEAIPISKFLYNHPSPIDSVILRC
jgi:hypothetical protein